MLQLAFLSLFCKVQLYLNLFYMEFLSMLVFFLFFTPKTAFTKLRVCKLILTFQFLDFQCLPVSIFLSSWSHNPFRRVLLSQGPCCIPGPYSTTLPYYLSDMNVSLCRNNYLLITCLYKIILTPYRDQ